MATTTKTTKTGLRFFWNGIKGSDGKLQLASCGFTATSETVHGLAPHISVYARRYRPFSAEVREAFTVQNGTDIQVDYFEQDHFRCYATHPLFPALAAAVIKRYEREGGHEQSLTALRSMLTA